MAKKNQINVKVNNPTNEAIEEFADSYDFTKAEAVRRMVEDRLAGEGYLDQPTGKVVPDGGVIEQKLDSVHGDMESLESDVNKFAERQSEQYQVTMLSVALVFCWIAIVWTGSTGGVALPTSAIVLSGAGLIAILLYVRSKVGSIQ